MNLQYGSSGEIVKETQEMLISLGYSVGSPGADGLFGELTESAVRKFQLANGLTVDGIVGPETQGKLQELYNATLTEEEPDKPQSSVLPAISQPNLNQYMKSVKANPANLITIVNTTFNPPRAINFYGLAPDDLTESHSADFESIPISGRSSPLAAYTGSGSGRTTDIAIEVHEDYLKKYSNKLNNANLVEFIGEVKALTYPRYQGGVVIPPRVFIKVGEFFRMKAYCNSVSVTWKKPIREGRYISATLSMNFTEILSQSFNADEIATGGDLGRYFKWPG